MRLGDSEMYVVLIIALTVVSKILNKRGVNKMNKHVMQIMDPTGHTSVTWSKDNRTETDIARATFTQMIERGYQAFRVDKNGRQGTRMTEFDPNAEEMLIIPHMQGG